MGFYSNIFVRFSDIFQITTKFAAGGTKWKEVG